MAKFTVSTVLLSILTLAVSCIGIVVHTKNANDPCSEIQGIISSASEVFFPGDTQYDEDISHWTVSSNANATCSAEPGTAEDVASILQILGSTKTPFAIKGGGHATNPGFSSTTGVQISMARFNQVDYDAATSTVEVGSGLIWDDVYAALEPFGVNAVGGRAPGVGVAGFTLGGGYSWKTNQYGLTIDTVQAFELVQPNGSVSTVTANSNPDLFFGLKGGFNNFGIVTKFTFNTYPQTNIWAGSMTVAASEIASVSAATVKFNAQVTDPKAAVVPTYNYGTDGANVQVFLFYDAPTPPAGIFDDFLAIPSPNSDVSTRSFLSLITSSTSTPPAARGVFNTLSIVKYTPAIMAAVANETQFWGQQLKSSSVSFVQYDIEPFLSTLFSHAAESSSAYPPTRSIGYLPLNIYFAWDDAAADDVVRDAARASAEQLTKVVIADGQDIKDAPLYGNYAIAGTPLEKIYGANVPKLQALKGQYDPEDVMGLTGGWKL